MTKKKSDSNIQTEIQQETQIQISSKPDEETQSISDSLAEIRKLEGVIGYIFRSEMAAKIDLNEPDKIIEYAMLSTELLDCTEVIEQQFDVGSVECIIAEGKHTKVLCIANGINRISVFMSNTCDQEKVRQKIAQAKMLYLTKK
jgi:predicted regulator of Ras-like GTPase activity (Roadblock/LC7/MglB family)